MNNYVQYGCGMCAPIEWRNFDVSPSLLVQKIPVVGRFITRGSRFPDFPENVEYGDIVDGLPVREKSCKAVYCSHVLEHLALKDFRIALKNTYRYLNRGGTFRLVLPDLEALAREYVNSSSSKASHKFMKKSYLGSLSRPKGIEGLLRSWLGNSNHLWMWDFSSIKYELENTGFDSVRRAEYGDSDDPHFDTVEDKHRWDGNLGVECIKP